MPAVRELFKQVFAVELSLQHWDWKYANGGGVGMVVRDDQNQIAAYYGGVERRILDRGEPALTLQCCDTMVATTQRGTLSKKGPYFLAATTFLDTYIGYNRPYLFGFGFPNKRVMRLGEHLGVQADIGGVVQIEWEPASQDKLAGESFNADDPEHSRLLEGLWQAMSAEMGHKILTVRDQAYIQYRYLDNPTREYELTIVRDKDKDKDKDKPIGMVVTRQENGRLLLLEVVGSPTQFPSLVLFCRDLARRKNLSGIYGWVTEADLDLFADEEMTLTDIAVRIPTSVCTDGPPVEELKDKWYLTAGDTDFL